MFLTLYANSKDEILEHPDLAMLGRSGNGWVLPETGEMIPLPGGASLVKLPGYFPVGLTEDGGLRCLEREPRMGGKPTFAIGALLPQGFTRTLLPASVNPGGAEPLPLFGYAALGLKNNKIWVAAIQSDEHRKWHPRFYNTEGLPPRIARMMKKYPDNRILQQLARCSLEYSCYTAQNFFYGRWEAGIPTTQVCNARCLGCISESHMGVLAPQCRLGYQATVKEVSELGIEHLSHARQGIISFGQGCEGDPSMNAPLLAQSIKEIRRKTDQGTINMNSNAGYTKGVRLMCNAGLDALRVSIFSCREESYDSYHRPQNYHLADVAESILYAQNQGLQVSLNLLIFPGFTDREEELEALLHFLARYPVDMIQLRNLNIDPDSLLQNVPTGGEALGISHWIKILQREAPQVKLASYTHPVR